MNEIIPATNIRATNVTSCENKASLMNSIINSIPAFFCKKKVSPQVGRDNESLVEINNDLTTYIRCLFHDFRGPLNNISLGIEVLLEDNKIHRESVDILNSIKESCSFLSESLDGFLNMENITDVAREKIVIKFEPFNIVGMVKKIQYILMFNTMKKKINIKYNIHRLSEWVIGDYKNIQHVILNLLSNAIKFSTEGSTIILQLENIKTINKKQHIVISIVDESGFISQSIKEKLFQKYNTSDLTNGTGLGLFICKQIVEMNGGRITHFNNNDLMNFSGNSNSLKNLKSGNIFQVELYLDICPSSETDMDIILSKKNKSKRFGVKKDESKKDESKKDGRFDMGEFVDISNNVVVGTRLSETNTELILKPFKKDSARTIFSDSRTKYIVNVMVIDDSEISRKLLVRLLENSCKRINIVEAIDGLDALIKMVKFKENNTNKISLVLVDNVMPNLTGELLSKILRGIGYDSLIIGITGNGLKEDKEKFLDNGADHIFVKPFNKQKLTMLLDLIKESGYDSKMPLKIIEGDNKMKWENVDIIED